jgi:homopolymeric O-antigen transport system permease protein
VAVNVQVTPVRLPTLSWVTRYRELLRTLVRRELRARFKGSALGLFWSLIYPLAMVAVYTLVFSVLWRVTGDIPHYPLFVLSGLAVWGFFQAGIQLGTTSLVANGELIKKVWFPRAVIPTAVVLAQVTTSLVMYAVLVPVNLVTIPDVPKTFLAAVPMLFGLLLLTMGLAFAFATLNVFYRDIEHLLTVMFLPWFFLTPVLYSLESIPAAASVQSLVTILRYGNPVTPYIEGIRGALWGGYIVSAPELIYMAVVGPAAAVLGLWVLNRHEDRLAIEL